MKPSTSIVTACAVVVAVLAYARVSVTPEPTAPPASTGASDAYVGPGSQATPDERPEDDAELEVVVVDVVAGEDPLSARWDSLSPSARRDALVHQFGEAVTVIERTREPRAHARADGALSALRAELYATEAGRKQHRALEARLVAAARRPSEDSTAGGTP